MIRLHLDTPTHQCIDPRFDFVTMSNSFVVLISSFAQYFNFKHSKQKWEGGVLPKFQIWFLVIIICFVFADYHIFRIYKLTYVSFTYPYFLKIAVKTHQRKEVK